MKYLLDTNMVIGLLHPERRKTILPRVLEQPPGAVVTSVIVAFELFFGAAKSRRPDSNRRRFDQFLTDLTPLEFTVEDSCAAGSIRAGLQAAGTPIGPYDVLIAGQAKTRGMVLVTNNMREFQRIPGLHAVDWLGGS